MKSIHTVTCTAHQMTNIITLTDKANERNLYNGSQHDD